MSRESVTPEGNGRPAVVIGLVAVGLMVAANIAVWAVHQGPDGVSGASLAGARPTQSPAPVPMTDGEAYVRTEVLPSGDVMVTHWIESAHLVFSVRLVAPLVAGTEDATAEQVHVTADGSAALGPEQIHSGMASRYSFVGATSLEIRYRLTDAIERSSSAPGRALARLTALDVEYVPASQHVTRTVVAPEVLSLACSSPATTSPLRPCGARSSDGGWTVDLTGPGAHDRVVAQLTLG
jgi:hypothetical protein